MAKRKKRTVKKKRPAARATRPKKVVTTQSRTTTIGKVKRGKKNAGYYMNRAKDQLYDELSRIMIRKEKATRKSDKKKISKLITEKRRQINKLK